MARNMLFTFNGHSMFDISSLVQKAIRRGDEEYALYAAHEMMWKYRPYLWKRLLTVSAEDCYDPVTKDILHLRKLDKNVGDPNETKFISEAVNLLVRTRKSRDADFFACNLIYSKKRKEYKQGESIYVTRHGHDLKAATESLYQAIFNLEDENVGYLTSEIWNWYKRLFWVIAKRVANDLSNESLIQDVNALEEIDLQTSSKNGSWIFLSKALVSFFHCIQNGATEIFTSPNLQALKNVTEFTSIRSIPAYTYDVHTSRGKVMGKTRDDFIRDEQVALKPLQPGMYDNEPWTRFKEHCENGWGDDYETPKLSRSDLNAINRGEFPTSLFD